MIIRKSLLNTSNCIMNLSGQKTSQMVYFIYSHTIGIKAFMLKKTLLCCLLCCLPAEFVYSVISEPASCTLQHRIVGKSSSFEQSVSQYLIAFEEQPSHIKDLPVNVGPNPAFFSVRLGDKDFNILLDVRERPKSSYSLYIDSDRDDYFSDEKAYPARSIKPGWFGQYDQYRFGPVQVAIKTDSGQSPRTPQILFLSRTRPGGIHL